MLSLVVALVVGVAHADEFSSEPLDFVLEDTAELYNSSEYSTGWLPPGSPLGVQFSIASEGGAWVQMEGQGNLTWPDALTLQLDGQPGTGEIIVDAELAAVTALRFDVAGYTWEEELDRRGIVVEGEGEFDPFLLTGGTEDRVSVEFEGNRTQLIDYAFNVFTGVNLQFYVDLGPEAVTTFEGRYWWTEEGAVAEEGARVVVAPSGEAIQTTDTTFVGLWQSELALVFNPVFSVCVDLIGCWDLVDLDLPIPLASDNFEQEFAPTYLDFPLPGHRDGADALEGPVSAEAYITRGSPPFLSATSRWLLLAFGLGSPKGSPMPITAVELGRVGPLAAAAGRD